MYENKNIINRVYKHKYNTNMNMNRIFESDKVVNYNNLNSTYSNINNSNKSNINTVDHQNKNKNINYYASNNILNKYGSFV